MTGLAGAAGAAGAPPVVVEGWTFDSGMQNWLVKEKNTGAGVILGTTEGTTATAASGFATWSVPFTSNTASQTAILENYLSAAYTDLSGKTLTAKIRLKSGGIGTGSGATAGFTLTLIAIGGSPTYTNKESASADIAAVSSAFTDITLPIPVAATGWDPTAVMALHLKVVSRVSTGGTYNYTTAIFELDSITY